MCTFAPIPEGAEFIISKLNDNKKEAYLVGGCVRDSLRGVAPHDWDICTSARPEEVADLFKDCSTIIPTGLKHGTVTITVALTGESFEVTTFRTEEDYSDGRHPDAVHFVTSLEQDLSRRDFTINAMAYHPLKGLIDPFDGYKDLKDGVLRAVGSPDDRLAEDPLRILRAIRFATVLDFEIDTLLEQAIHNNVARLDIISRERVWSELFQILSRSNLKILQFPDVILQVFPVLRPCYGFDQHSPWHEFDVFQHSLKAAEAVPTFYWNTTEVVVLRLATLLHDVGKPDTFELDENGQGHFKGHPKRSAEIADAFLRQLHVPNKIRECAVELIRWHDYPFPSEQKSVRRTLAKFDYDFINLLLTVRYADIVAHGENCPMLDMLEELEDGLFLFHLIAEHVLSEQNCFKIRDLAITGKDILSLGVPEGPRVGELLNEAFKEVVDGNVPNDRLYLVEWARYQIAEEAQNDGSN